MKKTKIVFCAVILLVFAFSAAAATGLSAVSDEWKGEIDEGWYDGSAATLAIKDAADLGAFAKAVNEGKDFSGKTVELDCDIVWNAGSSETWKRTPPKAAWTPIGTSSKPFTGTFDGKGHVVSGLYYRGTGSGNVNVGFFGYTSDAKIKDLHIRNSYFNAYTTIGSIAGYARGSLEISGCSSDASLVSNYSTPSDHNLGGIVGNVGGTDVKIHNCAFFGCITSDDGCNIGGIAGRASGDSLKIYGCFASGTYTGYNRVAGILARAYSSVEIYDCFASCDLYTVGTPNIGGIIGGFRENGKTVYIHECYYEGNFYRTSSSTFGSVKPIPTRLGSNEIGTDGTSIFGTFNYDSNYYTDSTSDNSYDAQGNQTGLTRAIKKLGGKSEFLAQTDSFALDYFGSVYPTFFTVGHDHTLYRGKWVDDPESDGQICSCTYPGCPHIEKRAQSIAVASASVRFDGPAGIKFLSQVDKNAFYKSHYGAIVYSYSGADLKFGTLIAYSDELSGELTIDSASCVNVEATSVLSENSGSLSYVASVYGFAGTIENYNRTMTVRSYMKYTEGYETVYVYSSPVECSYLDVAENAYSSGKLTGTQRSKLDLVIALGVIDHGFYDESPDRVVILENATPKLFYDFASALAEEGFKAHTNYEYSDNLFGVYYNDDFVVSFYYTPKTITNYVEPNQEWYAYGTIASEITEDMEKIQNKFGVKVDDAENVMRVIVEERKNVDLPATKEENVYTRLDGMKNSITHIFPNNNYSHYGEGYVIQLADGSFIIIDGGENVDDPRNSSTNTDSDNLYKFLMSAKPASHEKPIIAAWFLTHRHNDHIDVINGFLPEYRNKVVIEQIVFNFSSGVLGVPTERADVNRYADIKLRPYLKSSTKIITSHTGYKFYIRNAEVQVLYSIDDLYPFDLVDGFINNESPALSITIDGEQRLMILGEVFVPGSRALVNMYGEDLASDVIQLSHHGHYGATEELYRLIWPASQDYSDEKRFVLWPIGNEEQRRNRLGLAENLWILKRIAEDVGITWRDSWDTYINSVKKSSAYSSDGARFKEIGTYLTGSSVLGYMNGSPLWNKIRSMCDMIFATGKVTDRVGSTEADYVPASGVLETWETMPLYTK